MGLGSLSEEPLEANNKDTRKFLNEMSRKCDQVSQLTDCMNRTLERSHPKIRDIISKYRPDKKCIVCGQAGHTIKTHDKVTGVGEISQYDAYVCDILMT